MKYYQQHKWFCPVSFACHFIVGYGLFDDDKKTMEKVLIFEK